MNRLKKGFALLLSVCLVLGMMVPVQAADAGTFTVSVPTSLTVKAGETVTVPVTVSCASGWGSVTASVAYPTDVFDAAQTTGAPSSDWMAYMMSAMQSGAQTQQSVNPNDATAPGLESGWGAASMTFATTQAGGITDSMVVANVVLKAKQDVESGTAALRVSITLAGDGTSNHTPIASTQAQNGSVTITGALPTINTVTLSGNAVEVNGTTGGSVTAAATSAKGTNITSGVTWSVSPDNQGVTISNAGAITVDPKAQADTYTVTAAAKTGSSQGASKTATFTVTRATPAVAAVRIDATPSATIAKPVGSAQAKTVTYTAKVFDQYGDVMNGQNVTWTNTNAPANVTVENNVVTVPADAATGKFTLTATCGSEHDDLNVSVVDIEFTGVDAGVTTKAATYGMTWGDIITVTPSRITAKVGDATVTGTYTVANKDQRPGAGAQTGTVTFTSNDQLYKDIPVVTKSVDVAKKAITVTAENKSRPYGNANPELTWTVKASDLVGSDTKAALTVNLTCAANATTAVGKVDITGTGTADNYAITVTKGTLTITPVKVTAAAGMHATLTLSKAQVAAAADLKALGLAEKVTLSFSDGVADAEVAATYNKDLAAIKSVANSVTAAADRTVEVILTNACFPAYADKAGSTVTMPKTTITITNKYVIPEADITIGDVTATYGETYTPTASVADKPEYAGATFAYAYTDANGKAVAEPKNAGTYTITVTAENDNYKGTKTATLTIEPKPAQAEWLTLIIPEGGYVYDGKAKTPAVEVKDGETVLKAGTDYTVTYEDNVNASVATISGDDTGNEDGNTRAATSPALSGNASGGGSTGVIVGGFDGLVDTSNTVTTDNGTKVTTVTTPAGVTTITTLGLKSWVCVEFKGNYAGTIRKNFAIAPAPLAEVVPTVSGTPKAGSVLSAAAASVIDAPNQLTWKWYVATTTTTGEGDEAVEETTYTEIANATGASYAVVDTDSNKVLAVQATAVEDGNYTGATAYSKTVTVAKTAIRGQVTVTETNKQDGEDGKIEIGDTLTAAATVTPTVDVAYQWYNNGKAIEDATQATYEVQEGDAKLTVTVTPADENYEGSVTSATVEVGKTTLTGTVTLAKTTEGEGDEAKDVIKATITGAPETEDSYTIVWLRDGAVITGQSETTYALTAADKGHIVSAKLVGKGDYTGEVVAEGIAVAAEAPAAPKTNTSAGNGQVTVSWTAPADNGAPITGYTVEITAPVTQTVSLSAATTRYTFTGLTNDTEYTFTVKAVNAIGAGEAAEVKATPKKTTSGGNVGGGGGGGVSTDDTQTVTNPDGSKTTTVTSPDGTVKETTVATDGTKTEVVTKPDGSATASVTQPNGVKAQATTTAQGETTATVTVPDRVDEAKVTIPVKNVTPGTVAVLVKPDGTEEVLKTSVPTDKGVAVKLTESAELKLVDKSKEFEDTTGHWAEPNVDFVTARDLFQGTSETTFAPNTAMTRGMLVTVLYRLDGERKGDAAASFTDVTQDAWYTDAVAWGAENKVVEGLGNDTFAPTANITREQLAAMVYRYAKTLGYGYEGEWTSQLDFNDTEKVSDWSLEAVNWLVDNGVLTGKPGQLLDPQGNATRAEVATVLERFVKLLAK